MFSIYNAFVVSEATRDAHLVVVAVEHEIIMG
jgi:hypothetical protein